jgi:imidazolonepropionase-like amidohydrolase
MPGMWDAHAHFLGLNRPDLAAFAGTTAVQAAARATIDLGTVLYSGFTSVRELGGFGLGIAPAIDDGTVPGPHVYGAGALLSPTGGHADIHGLPLEWIGDPAFAGYNVFQLADGVAECLRAVRLQLRRGAKVIKICASGGVLSELDHPIHQQFSDTELVAIVEEAARADRVVAAHCHGKAGIMAALRAGARTIEHGTYLDREAIDLMLEREAVLVPTRFAYEGFLAMKGEMPAYAYDKLAAIADRHAEATRVAIEAGVTIAGGSDWIVSGSSAEAELSREAIHLMDLGMSPLGAVAAMTANGPSTVGPQARQSGRIEVGFDADLIAFDRNPLTDRSAWADRDRVTHVWKAGHLVKSPPG